VRASIRKSSLILGIACGLLTWVLLALLQEVLPFSPFITKVAFAVAVTLVLYTVGLIQRRPSFAIGYSFGVCGTLLVAMAGISIAPTINDYAERTSFEQARWKSEGESGIRVRMVDDLLHRYHLIGWSKDQVEGLLGMPPASQYFKNECDWLYWLGPERGFISIDSEWLCLKFEGDIVVKASLVRD
jgi:hypothetical protein